MSKDLTKPTKAQIVHRNRSLADALLANKRKATGSMRDDKGGRCCLQVAEDYAISCGLDIQRSEKDQSEPPAMVGEFFGWGIENPELVAPNGLKYLASELNDGLSNGNGHKPKVTEKGLSHKEIAECFVNTFVAPKKPKWSFQITKNDA